MYGKGAGRHKTEYSSVAIRLLGDMLPLTELVCQIERNVVIGRSGWFRSDFLFIIMTSTMKPLAFFWHKNSGCLLESRVK